MNKTLLLAATALAALTLPAAADALPKAALGNWCAEANDDGSNSSYYKRGNCPDSDGKMTVKPNSVTYWESGCTFSFIKTRIQKQPYYNSTSKAFEVKAKCDGEGQQWNTTLYFYPFEGGLGHEFFADNELPYQFQNKTVCKDDAKAYSERYSDDHCDNVSLRFEQDRYTIFDKNGESIGFCRFASVWVEWDPNVSVSTKTEGGPVTYIAAQCPKGQKLLALHSYKNRTLYVDDKGK
jgi:hypothetical protein